MGADAELDFLTCDSGLRAVLGLSVMSLEEASTIQPGLLTLSCTKQMVPTRRALTPTHALIPKRPEPLHLTLPCILLLRPVSILKLPDAFTNCVHVCLVLCDL